MAETHGVLDGPDGHPDPSSYSLIADRDGLTYKSPRCRQLYGGEIDTQPLNGKNEWIYYPPGPRRRPRIRPSGCPTYRTCSREAWPCSTCPARRTPSCVCPSTRSAPGLSAGPSASSSTPAGAAAPSRATGADLDGAIKVKAPKASITTVLMSSYFEAGDLEVMALWQWLVEAGTATPALRALILDRLHYMFTPYRELTIVHAVRQPLTPPVIVKLTVERSPGTTYALLIGDALAQVQSTIRVDVLAAWADPYDDGKSVQGAVLLDKTSRVDEIPLALGQSDLLPLYKIRHDFGDTKHHEVFYNAVATTTVPRVLHRGRHREPHGTSPRRLLDRRLRPRHGRGSLRPATPRRSTAPAWTSPRTTRPARSLASRVGRSRTARRSPCSSWPLP